MAKVAGGAGLNFVARLDTNRFKREKAEFEKMLKDLGVTTSKASQGLDTRQVSAYQQGMNKLKQELLEQKKVWQELRNEEALAKGISAESKAAVDALKIAEQQLTNQLRAGRISADEYALSQKRIVDAQKLAVAQQREADRQAAEANKRQREQLALARQQEQQRERNRRQLARESSEYYKLNQALNTVRNRAKDVQAAMFRLEQQGKKNSNEYATLERRSKNLNAQTQVLNRGITQIDASLGLHQRHVGDYGRALDGLSPIFASVNARLALLGTSLDQLATRNGLRAFGTQIAAVGGNILKFLISPVGLVITALGALFALFQSNKGTVIDFDDRLLNVGKTTGLTGRSLNDLGKELVNLSRRLETVSAIKLAEYATVAGQLGVKGKDDILAFSEALAKLEIATDIKGEDGGKEIARLLTLTDGGVQNVGLFGDEIVNLGNNFAATEKEILSNAEAISQNTGLYRIGRQDVLAYAVATKAVGLEAEVVGSSFNRTLATFEKSIRTGKNLDVLAKQTGLSIDELKAKFRDNAAGVFNDFIKGLNQVDQSGGSVNAVLNEIGISAVRDQRVIATLATSGYDVLSRAMVTVRDASGSMNQEFDTASGKLVNQSAKFGVAWDNLVLSIENGQGVIGRSAAGVVGAFTDIVDGLTPSTRSMFINEEAVKSLTSRYDELQEKSKLMGGAIRLSKEEQEELRKVTAQIGDLIPSVITRFDAYGNALDINRGKVDSMTKAQRELLAVQNKSALRDANQKFNSSVNAQKAFQDSALEGTGFFINDKDIATFKDQAVLFSGYAYEAAKEVRALGGTLTKAQKDTIAYYEKQEEVIKKTKRTVTENELETAKSAVRSTDVIKAEIKTLVDAQKGLDTKSKASQDNAVRLRALRKELSQANGSSGPAKPRGEDSEIKQQRSMQAEIDALTKKGRSKQLDADAQELADIDAKYAKIRAKAVAFNKDPKNKSKGLKVDAGGLLLAQSTEEDALRDKQSSEKLKVSLDAQKKLYDDFEQYKTKIGADAAKERFANEVGSAESYLEYLNQQRNKLLGVDDTSKGSSSGGENTRLQLEVLDKQIAEERAIRKKADNEIFANAILAAQTHLDKLKGIELQFNQYRKALGENATKEQLEQLAIQEDAAKRAANAENAYRLAGVDALMENIDALTRQKAVEGLNKAIAIYKVQYEKGFISAKEYYDKLAVLESKRSEVNGTQNNPFARISESIKRYQDQLRSADANSTVTKNVQKDMFAAISDGAGAASQVIGDVAGSLQELGIGGEGLQDTLKGVQGILDGASGIAKGIASGNPVDIITGSIKLLTSAITLFNTKDKNLEKQIKKYQDQLKSLGKAYAQLDRDVQNSVGTSVYSDQAAQIENLKQQQIALTKARDAERGKKKADQGKIDEYQNQIDSIPGQIEDVQKAIAQNLIQGTFKDLSNSLADALTSAFAAGEDGIAAMDKSLDAFIANAIKGQLRIALLEAPIKKFTDELTEYAKGNNNSVLGFDFDKYKDELKKAGANFNDALKGAGDFFKDTGTATGGSNSNAVSRAQITEETGSRLEGIARVQYDEIKRQTLVLTTTDKSIGLMYKGVMDSFVELQAINANTFRTANNTDLLNNKLDAIIANTKPTVTPRGQGI